MSTGQVHSFRPLEELVDAQLFDEYGELDRQVKLFKPIADRHEAVRKAINVRVADRRPAKESFVLSGALYDLQVSARRKESFWKSKAAIWKLLGGMKGLVHWDVSKDTVKEAAKLSDKQVDALRSDDQTGYRNFIVVQRAPVTAVPPQSTAKAA